MNDRTNYIGGSDVAAILGISPWRTAWDVWAEKTADPSFSPQEETPAMRWGTLLEPILLDEYERVTGRVVDARQGEVVHNEYDYLRGHVDGWVSVWSVPGVVEAKTASSDRDWQNGIPEYYQSQGYFYLALTDAPWCDFAVLFPRGDFRIIRLDADEAVQRGIIAACVAFWENHVVPRIPPKMDASPAATRWLARMPDDDEYVLEAGAELEDLVTKLADTRLAQKRLDAVNDLLTNEVKLAIGEHQKAVGRGWHITYRRTKPFPSVDWKQAATRMHVDMQLAGLDAQAEAAIAAESSMVENRRPLIIKRETDQ